MEKLEAYSKVRDRSLFALLEEPAQRELVEASELFFFDAGTWLPANPARSELFIVVDGEVGLYTKGNRNARQGSVLAGRALELKAFLETEEAWQFDWVAEKPTYLLRLPRAGVESALAKTRGLRQYLVKMTKFPEIRRFRNDLRIFGFTLEEIREVINRIELLDFSKLAATSDPMLFLLIMANGRLTLFVAIDDVQRQVGSFLAGDYFVFSSQRNLKPEFDPKTQVWALRQDSWVRRSSSDKVNAFLAAVDPVGAKIASFEKARQRAEMAALDEPPPDEEDDGLTVEDFLPPEKELKRLYRRQPVVIKQHDEMDCGAACLAMVARFHRRRISLPTFRSLVHVTREGASMLALKKAAETVGMQSIGVMSSPKGLCKLQVPMIALMQYHFVVVYRITETEVVMGDPARGLVKESVENFSKGYSKNVLLLKPTPKLAKYPESAPSFKKYLLVFRGSKGLLAESFVASLVVFLLGLAGPLFLQVVFDNVLTERKKGLLQSLALAVISLNLFSGIMDWVQNYLLSHVTSRLDAKFSSLFVKHVFRLPLSFFAVRRVGDITSRMGEIEKVREFCTGRTLSLLISLISAALYAAVVGLYSMKLLGFILVMTPLLVFFVGSMVPRLTRNLMESFKAQARNASTTFEQFNSLDTLKTLNGAVAARWRWEMTFLEQLALRKRFEYFGATISSVAELFRESINSGCLLFAVYLYMNKEMTLGQVIAISGFVANIVRPLIAMTIEWQNFNQTAVSLGRIDDIVTSALEADPRDTRHSELELSGDIEFQNVTFQYGSELSPIVLDNVSLSIKAGETVALVGRSGSGKTTLGYMVNLLYMPTRGKILINGVDAMQVPLATLRRQVAMIIQENSVFSGSIIENITLGDRHPSFSNAMEAAKRADAHEFVSRMADGYSSVLGDGGVGLSGGQKQRINIARALYRNPRVLIMDEATSALDAVSEAVIVGNLKARANKQTTIIIAHRLNTIMHADKIVVMEKGKIVETGTHRQLLERRGDYYELFRKQLNL